MDNIASTAYVSVRGLSAWLADLYGLNEKGKLTPGVLDITCEGLETTFSETPEFRLVGAKWERHGSGIILNANSQKHLLDTVMKLRTKRDLPALRFGQWSFVSGIDEDARKRCIELAYQADPPNNLMLADLSFINSLEFPVHAVGHTGLPAPPRSSWLSVDPKEKTNKAVSIGIASSPDAERTPVRGYADIWGTEKWADKLKQYLPSRQRESSLTQLCSGITSEIKRKADALQIDCKMIQTGPGADACHIVASDADKILRLAIWVQAYFASHGGAFLPWTLGVGVPQYNDGQPSDDGFRELHQLLEHTRNGDIVATPGFAKRLQRAEFVALMNAPFISPKGAAIDNVVEIRWWDFPFRSTKRFEKRNIL